MATSIGIKILRQKQISKLIPVVKTVTENRPILTKHIPVVYTQVSLKHQKYKFKVARREKTIFDYEMRKSKEQEKDVERLYAQYDYIINMSYMTGIIDPYVPVERRFSSRGIKQKSKQTTERLQKRFNFFKVIREIKRYEDGFKKSIFLDQALDIYKEANKSMENLRENEDRLLNHITEYALPKMTLGLKDKTFRWEFVRSLEPARLIHGGISAMLTETNLYAQLTVRFHTVQKLAIYDRFGRLVYGDENVNRDVLEYIVFEKHISDTAGRWRIAAKIDPEWKPAPEISVLNSYRMDNNNDDDEVLEPLQCEIERFDESDDENDDLQKESEIKAA